MALRSGLAAQLGFAVESTYGTYVAATRFLEFTQEKMNLNINRIESKGLRSAQRVLRSDHWTAGKRWAAGDIEFEVGDKGFGLLLKHMLGAVAAPVAVGTGWKHSVTLADPTGLFATIQIGKPDVSGTVQPFSYQGCKFTAMKLKCDLDGVLMLTASVDAQDEQTGTALVSATSPVETQLLYFTGGVISVGGSSVDLTSFELDIDFGLKTDRFFIRNNNLKKEPLPNKLAAVTGKLSAEWDTLTQYARFTGGTQAQIVATFQAPTKFDGSNFPQVVVTLPACRFDGSTPNVNGPDEVMYDLPFVAMDNGTNPPVQIDYQTTDAAP